LGADPWGKRVYSRAARARASPRRACRGRSREVDSVRAWRMPPPDPVFLDRVARHSFLRGRRFAMSRIRDLVLTVAFVIAIAVVAAPLWVGRGYSALWAPPKPSAGVNIGRQAAWGLV